MFSIPIPSFRSTPLLSTTLQAICINTLANIIAQYIEFRKVQSVLLANPSLESLALDLPNVHGKGVRSFHVDLLRVLQFVVWTCITVPPNFRWQGWLEKRFPAYYEEKGEIGGLGEKGVLPLSEVGIGSLDGERTVPRSKKRNLKHTFLKILCDQGIAAPINCTMFLSVMTLLKGGTLYEAAQTVRTKFWPLKFAGWRIWPLVGLVNFTFVPVERRVIVSTIIGLCWNVFLVLFIS